MSKTPDAKQLARLRKLAAMPDEQIDTSDMPIVEDWSLGVRGGTPGDVRWKLTALGKLGGMQPGAREPSLVETFILNPAVGRLPTGAESAEQ